MISVGFFIGCYRVSFEPGDLADATEDNVSFPFWHVGDFFWNGCFKRRVLRIFFLSERSSRVQGTGAVP